MNEYTDATAVSDVSQRMLLRDGFVVVKEVVPPAQLDALRTAFETIVGRQREQWRRERKPADPPEGVWEIGAQPRVSGFDRHVHDAETAIAVEWCLDAEHGPLTVSRRIMEAPDVAPTAYMLMCSPQADHGPAAWHRDIHPIDQAPLCALEQDLFANGPGYLQWNIGLYDDDVLWVVPGSHRRPNNEDENEQLRRDNRAPLPGGQQVRLKAGDGVAYTNTILHWGSNYSRKLRRTVHLGYRSLGGQLFPYVPGLHRGGDATPHLQPAYQELVARHRQLYLAECDRVEALYRAMIECDGERFVAELDALHPGEESRIVTLIILSKMSHKLQHGDHPHRPGYCSDWTQEPELSPRFSQQEREQLWRRFAWLDSQLQTKEERFTPGFQSGPMHYYFEELPEHLTAEAVIANWNDG
ncbi:MAG: phytanoyl-CoA dioxygenase family protein [Candidatus Latescibacterota bacterium]|nr:phytanoyl-CoA dioxygenase family protein [Candidatus Latescibacterota bacterium]